MTRVTIVSTTTATPGEARRLARLLVESGLAACVQITPIRSVYRWKGRMEEADEHLLQAKTTPARARQLVPLIRRHHSYELPEILVASSSALPAYARWVAGETAPARKPRKRA